MRTATARRSLPPDDQPTTSPIPRPISPPNTSHPRRGRLTPRRGAQRGLVTGTTLGAVTTAQSYDSFGAALTSTASANGSSLLGWQYSYDALARITQKAETINGVSQTFSYAYDLAGH